MRGIGLKLQGQFKFDLYRPNGELIRSSEYVDNFITNSGVMYPYYFAFADCFRFLSIGDGTTENCIDVDAVNHPSILPTTGLSSPISEFSYIGGRRTWDSYSEDTYYAQPGNLGGGCGFVNTSDGVNLIRQWNLPDNTGGAFTSSRAFKEFMVSPGRPYVTGIDGTKFCDCSEFDAYATGLDCSVTSEYYHWLADKYKTRMGKYKMKTCDATAAFSRVLYDFNVEVDSILTVTYKLNITINTGVGFTSLYSPRAEGNNWNDYLNLYGGITHPGVMLINDGIIGKPISPNGETRLQHFDYSNENGHYYDFAYEYGESFVPPMGAPLEPSNFYLINETKNQNISVYLSDDNLQFMVNKDGGKFTDTGHFAPWNIWEENNIFKTYKEGDVVSSGDYSYQYINAEPSSGNFLTDTSYWLDLGYLKAVTGFSNGVMPFRNDNDETLYNTDYWSSHPNAYNVRRGSGYHPAVSNILIEEAMGANYFESNSTYPAFIFSCPATGTRNAKVNYTYRFENYKGQTSLQARSFVCAYKDINFGTSLGIGDNKNLVPFFDSVLSGMRNSPETFIPSIVTGDSIVNNSTGAIIENANLPYYNLLESTPNAIFPIINTFLSWSVPCPNGVLGC
jgi:hypothetical protein